MGPLICFLSLLHYRYDMASNRWQKESHVPKNTHLWAIVKLIRLWTIAILICALQVLLPTHKFTLSQQIEKEGNARKKEEWFMCEWLMLIDMIVCLYLVCIDLNVQHYVFVWMDVSAIWCLSCNLYRVNNSFCPRKTIVYVN